MSTMHGPDDQPTQYGPAPYGTGWPPTPYGQGWAPAPTPPKRRGRTLVLAIGGAVLGVALAAGAVTVVVTGWWPGGDSAATPTSTVAAVPEVGSCHLRFQWYGEFNDVATGDIDVACEEPHHFETIAAGARSEPSPPFAPSDLARELYNECEDAAEDFLGQHWRTTHTWLVLSVPNRAAWAAGARWYRCDLVENPSLFPTDFAMVEGSLRDTFAPIACLNWRSNDPVSVRSASRVDCTQPHSGELAGTFRMPDGSDSERIEAVQRHCLRAAFAYLGASPADISTELGVWPVAPPPLALDRTVLCVVAPADGRRIVGSLENIGDGEIILE